MPNPSIDTQKIVHLYITEELSVRDIATRLDLSYGRVYGILRARVVMRRTNSKGPRRTTDYLWVAQIIRERITTGDWPANHKILTQQDLAQIFDVKHQTIREAIAHLRQHGYLMTVPNKGTYVRPPQHWESGKATTKDLDGNGRAGAS